LALYISLYFPLQFDLGLLLPLEYVAVPFFRHRYA